MIINGGSRSNGAFFAKHLSNAKKNEQVRVAEIRGLAAKNIGQAFYEMKAVASGTRCKNFFYHANLNPYKDERLTPEQWERAVDALEEELGLEGQARFVVEHEKHGRVHRHVVWSRIDVDQMKAIRMDKDYAKHQETARQLEKEFGLRLGRSVLGPDADKENRPERRPKPWETFRGQESGISVTDLKEEITELWRGSDSGEAFVSALQARGYILARGDSRVYCIVDQQGHSHSLAKRIEGGRVKAIEERLVNFDPKNLPHVKEAAAIQKERRAELAREEEQRQQALAEEETYQKEANRQEEERQQQAIKDEEQRQAFLLEEQDRARDQYKQQADRQAALAGEMKAQHERLEAYQADMVRRAELARRAEMERQSRRPEGEIRNAHSRYGQALAQHYSVRDPYDSLARSAMAEYGAFLRDRETLDRQIAKTSDPVERRRLELRQEIEAADYMAITSERIAGQSEIIVGKMNSPEALRQRERAKDFGQQAKALRQEYRELSMGREQGREAVPIIQQSPPLEPAASQRKEPATPSIMVEERKAGKGCGQEQRLEDFIKTLPEKPAWREFTDEEIFKNPAVKKAYYRQMSEEKNRVLALNQITKDMKWGNNLNMEDIKCLSREDLEGIKRHGDKHLKTIIQEHEKAKERDRGLER